jgi:hypothetical protein
MVSSSNVSAVEITVEVRNSNSHITNIVGNRAFIPFVISATIPSNTSATCGK